MNKSELTDAIAAGSGLTKKQAKDALGVFVSAVEETVSSGGTVSVAGFGTFRAVTRHPGKNCPRMGKPVKIPAKPRPVFKAGKRFREKVGKQRTPPAEA